ncbi:hypothetical protein KXP73_000230 [Staphylococcus pseudintermedius]|nr:hypothetical protein [Staphylococcus pseudintermedius]EHT3201320.1 hypothetical protein [Staphylococcus pseudintermedius]EKI4476806.1 hypothetical protein [Staphylococcus pseudintermedius]
MKLTVYDLTNIKNDIRKYLISESDIYVDGDKLYDVVVEIEDYKPERDTLINDLTNLRKQRDNYKSRAETLDNLKEYLSEARTLNIKCLEKMSGGYFKGKVAGRIQMIDELITVIRILEGE